MRCLCDPQIKCHPTPAERLLNPLPRPSTPVSIEKLVRCARTSYNTFFPKSHHFSAPLLLCNLICFMRSVYPSHFFTQKPQAPANILTHLKEKECPINTQHTRNSMTFCVSVPVLSVKTCSTWPRSSLSCEFCTISAVPERTSHMVRSHDMKNDWPVFTNCKAQDTGGNSKKYGKQ